MRPIYQTERDADNELAVKDFIQAKYNCNFVLTMPLDPFDAVILNDSDEVMALVEIKSRRNTSDKYPTYMLSAAKADMVIRIAGSMDAIPLLMVKFTDGVFVTKLKDGFERKRGGRYDRGDALDIEECIFIPMDRFRAL
jgi:hypothetical protein